MPLQLVCACGNQLRVPEAHAGRRVQCPRCGASQVVGEQAPARPLHQQGKPGKFPSLLALTILVPLLLSAAAGGWWWFSRNDAAKPPLAEDLALIPVDAPAFVSVRLQQLWETHLAATAFVAPFVLDLVGHLAGGEDHEQGPEAFAILEVGELPTLGSSAKAVERAQGGVLLVSDSPRGALELLASQGDQVGVVALPEESDGFVIAAFEALDQGGDGARNG